MKGLRLKSNLGYKLSANTDRSSTPQYRLASNSFATENQVDQSLNTGNALLWGNTLPYKIRFGKHSINALVGQSLEKNGMGEGTYGSNYNSMFGDFKHAYLSNTLVVTGCSQISGRPQGIGKLASFSGRMNYDYDRKYMITTVIRTDGSSGFVRGHRWGCFPSVSAGQITSEEPWFQPTRKLIDYLKFRASWGQNGNQDIPAFQHLPTISLSDADHVFGTNKTVIVKGAYLDILISKDLMWETSKQLNPGIDARFLTNRLGLISNFYIKNTVGWLVETPILDSYGTGAPLINGGDVHNSDIELSLDWNDRIDSPKYDVNWNMTHNKNEVTHIANSRGTIHGANSILSYQTTEIYRAQEGYPIGYFYGYQTAGIFQTEEQIKTYGGARPERTRPSDIIWVDRNKDDVIDEHDQGMIGNPHPDVTVGFGLVASHKGFDLSATLHGAFGHQIMKSYRSFVDYPRQNYTSRIFGRWHGPGSLDQIPRLTTGTSPNWQFASNLYMENVDCTRLKNVTLSYDFKQLLKHIPLQQLYLHFTLENSFTTTGCSRMDPGVGYGGYEAWVNGVDAGSYPTSRTVIVGVNVKF